MNTSCATYPHTPSLGFHWKSCSPPRWKWLAVAVTRGWSLYTHCFSKHRPENTIKIQIEKTAWFVFWTLTNPFWTLFFSARVCGKGCARSPHPSPTSKPGQNVTQSYVHITNLLSVQAYQFVAFRSPGKVLDFMRHVRGCHEFSEIKWRKNKNTSEICGSMLSNYFILKEIFLNNLLYMHNIGRFVDAFNWSALNYHKCVHLTAHR